MIQHASLATVTMLTQTMTTKVVLAAHQTRAIPAAMIVAVVGRMQVVTGPAKGVPKDKREPMVVTEWEVGVMTMRAMVMMFL